jgi:long-chain acyl-CoA synthetase
VTGPPVLDIAKLLAGLVEDGGARALTFYRGKNLDGRLTYGELSVAVAALAAGLRDEFRVQAGDRVAILAPNRLEIPVLVLALLSLGAVAVPLNPAASPEDWNFILRHSGARGIAATRDLSALVPQAARPEFTLLVEDAFELRSAAPPPPAPGDLPDRLGVVLYTSGTTGDPKGVGLRQRNLFSNAWSMAQNFGLRRSTQLAVLPLYHAHAFGFGLMTALSTGGHLVFTERLEPFTWAQVIREESVRVTSVVPTMLPMLLAAGVTREKVPTLGPMLVSSAPLPCDLARDFETRTNIRLVLGWGLSEYTNFACCVSPNETPEGHAELMYGREVPSIGSSLPGTEVRVVDEQGKPTEEEARGELMVRGHSTMQGYYADTESTARTVDAEGWLRTGDEGFFRTLGERQVFFVTGRLKEVIIRDAEKYSPLRLERQILQTVPEWSGKLVVLGFLHEGHGEEVGAYVETPTLEEEQRTRLLVALDALPIAERPKVVLFGAQAIPRTHTGKIQRRKMQPWFSPWVKHRGGTLVAPIASPIPSPPKV